MAIKQYAGTVKTLYKGHSREPDIVPFMSRFKLIYALFINVENETALY
jgi:hypothetical protein